MSIQQGKVNVGLVSFNYISNPDKFDFPCDIKPDELVALIKEWSRNHCEISMRTNTPCPAFGKIADMCLEITSSEHYRNLEPKVNTDGEFAFIFTLSFSSN